MMFPRPRDSEDTANMGPNFSAEPLSSIKSVYSRCCRARFGQLPMRPTTSLIGRVSTELNVTQAVNASIFGLQHEGRSRWCGGRGKQVGGEGLVLVKCYVTQKSSDVQRSRTWLRFVISKVQLAPKQYRNKSRFLAVENEHSSCLSATFRIPSIFGSKTRDESCIWLEGISHLQPTRFFEAVL